MKSPFPGMDPYLEDPAYWEDFHRRFITQIADYLLERLPAGYDARIDQRIRLVDADGSGIAVRLPDVAVTDLPAGRTGISAGEAAVATLEPMVLPMPGMEEERDVWIEVRRLPDRSLVTAIEVLSPKNKRGDGAVEYRNKRIELYGRHVNLVELDLLLGGERLHFGKPLPAADYYASVARDSQRPIADIYAWHLRDMLPTIPVPLRSPDSDIGLNLAEVFAVAFERGRYLRQLRYAAGFEPSLREIDAGWADKLLRETGRR
jgi:hypothetical protein